MRAWLNEDESPAICRHVLNLLRVAVFLGAIGRALRAVDDNLAPLD